MNPIKEAAIEQVNSQHVMTAPQVSRIIALQDENMRDVQELASETP